MFLELSKKIKSNLSSKSSKVVYKKFMDILDLENLPQRFQETYRFNWLLILASNDSLYSDAKNLIKEESMRDLFLSEENVHRNLLNYLIDVAGCYIQSNFLWFSTKTVCEKQVSINQCNESCHERAKELILDLAMVKALAEENYGLGTLFAYFR